MLERESALPAVQDVSEIFDVPLSLPPPFPSRERGGTGARACAARSSEIRSPNWICMIREVRGEKKKKEKEERNGNFENRSRVPNSSGS